MGVRADFEAWEAEEPKYETYKIKGLLRHSDNDVWWADRNIESEMSEKVRKPRN